MARRVRMLQEGGAEIRLLGFTRTSGRTAKVAGAPTRQIGRTRDARFLSRLGSIIAASLTVPAWIGGLKGADILIARNLEMLAVARVARTLLPGPPALAYEVLDIHRFLLRNDLLGRALRRAERWLAKPAQRLIVSSPAFLTSYYHSRGQVSAPALLVENKVLCEPDTRPSAPERAPGPPWRIGWFGMIRCNRSLKLLSDLCRALPGLVEVDIRGRLAQTEFEGFEATVAETPGMRFLGLYQPGALEAAYAATHFAWTLDFFEAGRNSDWLLPNRLYEGLWYGAVPLAQANVETGRWLAEWGCGVCFHDVERELPAFVKALTPRRYDDLVRDGAGVQAGALSCGRDGCRNLVQALLTQASLTEPVHAAAKKG